MNNEKILKRLKEGNERYLLSKNEIGDISEKIRADTAENGQHPFAVIISCSDSRVIPEAIFSCGVGELFVIRAAGNVVDDSTLGSVEYAAEHLGCKLVVVLGHTCCGAVGAAIAGNADGYVKSITDKIAAAIHSETDPCKASILNIRNTVSCLRTAFAGNDELARTEIVGALYDLESGKVTFLE
ncbi:MAG: carbonic anhydrase [Lachnospiraceae bacterium]|nr:carbonic anhydrase [Lachnospiraceae bacterium]